VKLRSHPLHNQHDYPDQSAPTHSPKWRVLSRTERALHHFGIAKVLYFRDISTETEVDQMKSQFLSTAAHELRTPMASVFGFSELLLSREFDSAVRHEILSTIHQQSESLVNMLTQLLDLARIESRMGLDFSFVRQPLWPIVERAMNELLIPGDQRKIKFTKPKTIFHVEVDADKLRQVISNVLVNAYKYSPNGGDIRLSIKQRKLKNSESEVGIIIKDKGLGMSTEQLGNIFDRFWRADNSGAIPGTGLGMSLVKEIMDIHQGEVVIDSKLDEGTCVSLWLKQTPAATV
jgi:signal transduction histidine kinase